MKKSKDETVQTVIHVWGDETGRGYLQNPPRSLRTKEEVDMADLSPPDHNGPPSHGRASRQLR